MNGIELKNADWAKDLGVTIMNNLKPSQQCSEIVKKLIELSALLVEHLMI